ncbi:hypothetical protein R3P38DRAFT_2787791 [Favolaschia claudopus]|uniref:Uncharacterized protein n=1 Tax=Favolaschia claudopus TaxID=2862362 RepID=A0AAW0AMZ7_9AGAR
MAEAADLCRQSCSVWTLQPVGYLRNDIEHGPTFMIIWVSAHQNKAQHIYTCFFKVAKRPPYYVSLAIQNPKLPLQKLFGIPFMIRAGCNKRQCLLGRPVCVTIRRFGSAAHPWMAFTAKVKLLQRSSGDPLRKFIELSSTSVAIWIVAA